MPSTVGLEVMDSINPQLNWKIVTKGRRSRTSVARRKLSAAVSGQQTSGKTEHVPIKKRRHLLRSPSPQPRAPSLCRQDSSPRPYSSSPPFEDNFSYSSHFSVLRSASSYSNWKLRDGSAVIKLGDGFDYEVLSEQVGGEHNYVGDFSGIELLAAAASMDDDVDHSCKQELAVEDSLVPKTSDISNPDTLFKQDSECNKSLSNEIVLEDDTDCSLVQNNLGSAARSLHGCVGGGTTARANSLKVDRRHWDLNTLMDAWDEPRNDTFCSKPLEDDTNNDIHVQEGRQGGSESQMPCNPGITEDKFSELEIEDKLMATTPQGTCIESSTLEETLGGPPNICYCNVTAKTSDQDTEKNVDYPSTSGKIESPATLVQKIVSTASSAPKTNSHITCVESMDLKSAFAERINPYPPSIEEVGSHVASAEVESHVASAEVESHVASSKKVDLEVASSEKVDSHAASSEKVNSHVASVEKVDSHLGYVEKVDLHVDSVEKVDSHVASAEKVDSCVACAEKVDSCTASEEKVDLHIASLEKIELDMASNEKIDSTVDTEMYSDACLDNHGHVVNSDYLDRFQEGHDSPYEDGELRGSFLYRWEENELENKRVDYESDGRHGDASDAGDLPGSEIVDTGSEGSHISVRKNLFAKRFLGRNQSNSSSSRSFKHSYLHFVEDESENTDRGGMNESDIDLVIGENENERRFSDLTDSIDDTVAHMDEYLLRTIQGKVQSCNKGQSTLDAFNGKDIFFLQQSRSRRPGGLDSHPEKDTGTYKFLSRYRHATHQSEKGGAEQWTYWGSKNHCPSSNQGFEGRNLNRTRKITGDIVDKFGRMDFDHKRQNSSYLSKGYLRRPLARSSPADRDDRFGMHRRMQLNRGVGENYPQGVGKKYETVPDNASKSVRPSPYLLSRERSFSPSSGRGDYIPFTHRRSRSRSRTRSPVACHSNKGREMGTSRHIRSPGFSSEARMYRIKFSNSNSTFTSDYRESYLSPPRGWVTPQCNDRLFDDLDFSGNHLRRRRSPVRFFRRSQKFDAFGYSGRLTSEDYFKPTIRPGRLSFLANGDREGKFETDYKHRRHDDRGEVVHRRRGADDGGNSKRFLQSAEADVIETTNLNNKDDSRGTDPRNLHQR